jgi:hypothetical protein
LRDSTQLLCEWVCAAGGPDKYEGDRRGVGDCDVAQAGVGVQARGFRQEDDASVGGDQLQAFVERLARGGHAWAVIFRP